MARRKLEEGGSRYTHTHTERERQRGEQPIAGRGMVGAPNQIERPHAGEGGGTGRIGSEREGARASRGINSGWSGAPCLALIEASDRTREYGVWTM